MRKLRQCKKRDQVQATSHVLCLMIASIPQLLPYQVMKYKGEEYEAKLPLISFYREGLGLLNQLNTCIKIGKHVERLICNCTFAATNNKKMHVMHEGNRDK